MEHYPDNLLDALAFVRVVETGGFGRAADRLGISKSIVSRRVARLEAGLGARLLARTARGAKPTDVGADYYARLSLVLADLEAAHEAVAAAVSEVAGPIRITAPLTFGARHLAPALAAFMKRHPRVELDVSLDDRTVDLVGGGFDLALRLTTSLPDSSLRARRLSPMRVVVAASPTYLTERGTPKHPRDLAGHEVLLYANAGPVQSLRFRVGGRWEAVRVHGRLRADNGEMLRQAAVAGLGLTALPSYIAAEAFEAGALVPILRDFPLDEGALYAIMPPGRSVTARLRALIDFLAETFGPDPTWNPCWIENRGAA